MEAETGRFFVDLNLQVEFNLTSFFCFYQVNSRVSRAVVEYTPWSSRGHDKLKTIDYDWPIAFNLFDS